jgi:hypothetical protein
MDGHLPQNLPLPQGRDLDEAETQRVDLFSRARVSDQIISDELFEVFPTNNVNNDSTQFTFSTDATTLPKCKILTLFICATL